MTGLTVLFSTDSKLCIYHVFTYNLREKLSSNKIHICVFGFIWEVLTKILAYYKMSVMTTWSSTVQEKEKKVNQEILTMRMFSLLSIFIVSEKVTQENFFSPLKEK